VFVLLRRCSLGHCAVPSRPWSPSRSGQDGGGGGRRADKQFPSPTDLLLYPTFCNLPSWPPLVTSLAALPSPPPPCRELLGSGGLWLWHSCHSHSLIGSDGGGGRPGPAVPTGIPVTVTSVLLRGLHRGPDLGAIRGRHSIPQLNGSGPCPHCPKLLTHAVTHAMTFASHRTQHTRKCTQVRAHGACHPAATHADTHTTHSCTLLHTHTVTGSQSVPHPHGRARLVLTPTHAHTHICHLLPVIPGVQDTTVHVTKPGHLPVSPSTDWLRARWQQGRTATAPVLRSLSESWLPVFDHEALCSVPSPLSSSCLDPRPGLLGRW
jgi:hypothetical protein